MVLKYSALHLDNTDTWFHLRSGDHFLGGWSLRHPGALSRFATSAWVPTQWSTEVLASWPRLVRAARGRVAVRGPLPRVRRGDVLVCRRAAGAAGRGRDRLVVFALRAALSARPQVVSLLLFG